MHRAIYIPRVIKCRLVQFRQQPKTVYAKPLYRVSDKAIVQYRYAGVFETINEAH